MSPHRFLDNLESQFLHRSQRSFSLLLFVLEVFIIIIFKGNHNHFFHFFDKNTLNQRLKRHLSRSQRFRYTTLPFTNTCLNCVLPLFFLSFFGKALFFPTSISFPTLSSSSTMCILGASTGS